MEIANFADPRDALDYLVNQATKDHVPQEENVREMAAYVLLKSEIQRLDQALRDVESLREAIHGPSGWADLMSKLQSENAANRTNAQRYLFLRDSYYGPGLGAANRAIGSASTAEKLDEAIDKAIHMAALKETP